MTTNHPSDVLCPLPRRIERVRVSITSPLVQPSPNGRRVGIRIVTFEACSGFTRVTARRIAQPPKVTFVTRLQSRQSPSETARQLPDLSTIIWVEPSSTDDSRLQGATPRPDIRDFGRRTAQFESKCVVRLTLHDRPEAGTSRPVGARSGEGPPFSEHTENGLVWSIDRFERLNQGLVIAEVELVDPEQLIELRPWLG